MAGTNTDPWDNLSISDLIRLTLERRMALNVGVKTNALPEDILELAEIALRDEDFEKFKEVVMNNLPATIDGLAKHLERMKDLLIKVISYPYSKLQICLLYTSPSPRDS